MTICDDNFSDFTETSEAHSTVDESSFNGVFACEICGYETEHKNGLQIHIGKQHKYKCDECALEFKNREGLNRHTLVKSILSNIEPIESPDDSKKPIIMKDDGTCLAVFDNLLEKNVALVHCNECWSICGHSCTDLPENELSDIHKDILHLGISSVVLGDLSMFGCFMDWSSMAVLLVQHLDA
jgi:hypothetical protein